MRHTTLYIRHTSDIRQATSDINKAHDLRHKTHDFSFPSAHDTDASKTTQPRTVELTQLLHDVMRSLALIICLSSRHEVADIMSCTSRRATSGCCPISVLCRSVVRISEIFRILGCFFSVYVLWLK